MVGTHDIGGVQCLDLHVTEGGQTVARAFGTMTDAAGGLLYATGRADGTISETLASPQRVSPANPPVDFTTTLSYYVWSGTYDAEIVSAATAVATSAGVFTNAVQVRMTCRDAATTGASVVSYWLVPDVGIVRMEATYATVGLITLDLQSYTGP